jgi:rhodanese-related sulfurtransferase
VGELSEELNANLSFQESPNTLSTPKRMAMNLEDYTATPVLPKSPLMGRDLGAVASPVAMVSKRKRGDGSPSLQPVQDPLTRFAQGDDVQKRTKSNAGFYRQMASSVPVMSKMQSPVNGPSSMGTMRRKLPEVSSPSMRLNRPMHPPLLARRQQGKSRASFGTITPITQTTIRPEIRRAQSMCVSADEFLHGFSLLTNSGMHNKGLLPSKGVATDALPRITCDTLVQLMAGDYTQHCTGYLIIDCRFPYEYEGGHIRGAVNINTFEQLDALLLHETPSPTDNIVLVFHCEHSALRGPRQALYLRERDRALNRERYPQLHYPDLYILEHGYSNFFQHYKDRCDPQSYVGMKAKDHEKEGKRRMNAIRRSSSFGYGKEPPLTRSNTVL